MFEFKDKNILIILKTFDLGGAEHQAVFLANYLQNSLRCNVKLISYYKATNPLIFDKTCEAYKLNDRVLIDSPFGVGKHFKIFKKLAKIFLLGRQIKKSFKPDIIIPYLTEPSILAVLLKYPSGAKYTFWNHRGAEAYKNNFLEKLSVFFCSYFLANSPNGKIELESQFKLNSSKVHFVPNFSTLKSSVEKDKDKNSVVLGMIAHFRIEKLQSLLIESCIPLFQKYPNLKLLLIGNVTDKRNIDNVLFLKKTHKLEDKVKIYHNRLAIEFLPKLDIGILISSIEGMSNSIMEYMYYNLPVLASKHSGTKILLSKANHNFLVENTTTNITKKLEVLIGNTELRIDLGNQNKNRIEKEFSIENYILNLEKIINHKC